MKQMTITDRCILWNSQRYEQEYDYDLAARLLLEETEELFQANGPISKMDAVGDIIFVAMGVFWKLGLNEEQVKIVFHEADMTTMTISEAHDWAMRVEWKMMDWVDESIKGAYPGITLACNCAFVIALSALRALNLQHKVYDIVHVICDSNHTKVIKGKTAANVKANIDKGASFVPPDAGLQKIYSENKIIGVK